MQAQQRQTEQVEQHHAPNSAETTKKQPIESEKAKKKEERSSFGTNLLPPLYPFKLHQGVRYKVKPSDMKTNASLLVVLLVIAARDLVAGFSLVPQPLVPAFPPLYKKNNNNNNLQQQQYSLSTRVLFASTFSAKTDEESPRANSNPQKEKKAGKKASKLVDTLGETNDAIITTTENNDNETSASRLRRLKDLVWVREALEDLTAAEFACSVEAHEAEETDETEVKKRKRAVDYEKLLSQLNRRINDLGCGFTSAQEFASVENEAVEPLSCVLQPNVGMGSIAYSGVQRQLLLERLLRTRHSLTEIIRGYKLDAEDGVDLPFSITLPDLRVEIPRETDDNVTSAAGPKLYVRTDGTVDWDGALQDQAALRKFGGAVWARINGRDPELLEGNNSTNGESAVAASGGHGGPPSVTARVIETPEIKHVRAELNALTDELNKMHADHIALLNSVISAGQAVANVNLASLAPAERSKILKSADALEKMREKVSYQTLLYELERIYTYLAGELGNPQSTGYISLQDRLNVAEFGLLESQVQSFSRQLESGDSIDADVLAVVMEQLNDFKRRLGIDYFVTGVTFDREAISRWLAELLDQTKKGLAFYVKGVRLFWNDIVFCLNLVSRAAQGYTLKPREVRTIRYAFSFFMGIIHACWGLLSNPVVLSRLQTNIQGYFNLHPFCDHSHYPPDSCWACSGVWCHSKILP